MELEYGCPSSTCIFLLPSQLPGNKGLIAGLLKGSGQGSFDGGSSEDHDLL